MKKRSQDGVWIDLSLTLGGLVALFAAIAGALTLVLSSGSHP